MNLYRKQSVVISFDNGELKGLSLLYSISFENYWLTWLSRFWTRSAVPLHEGTSKFGNVLSSPRLYHLRRSLTGCTSNFRRNARIPESVVVTWESTRFFS